MLEKKQYEALPSELGDDLAVTRANISGLLNALEKLRYIERKFDVQDRRRVKVVMTEEGKHILAKAWPIYEEVVSQIFNELSEEEKGSLLSMLSRL